MSKTNHSTMIPILDKDFKVKCPEDKVEELQKAGAFLNQRMQKIKDEGKISTIERICITVALNITYDYLRVKDRKHEDSESFNKHVEKLQEKIEDYLTPQDQLAFGDE